VREVSLHTIGRRGAALAKCPHLEQVQGLEIPRSLPRKELIALLTSPRLTDLQHLRLGGVEFAAGDVAALARAPSTKKLKHVFIGGLQSEHCAALLSWPSRDNWITLDLSVDVMDHLLRRS